MTTIHRLAGLAICLTIATTGFSQSAFQHCTAAFLNNQLLVSEYSPQGICSLAAEASGQLTVCTVNLSPTSSQAIDKITFRIAIRDQNTGTLVMYANQDFQQVDVQQVLAKCRKGDHIVWITLDNQYALPHNEIRVL